MSGQRPWMSPAEVAERLEVGIATPYRWVREGRLPAWRVGKSLRIDPADVDRFIQPARAGGAS